MRWNRPRFDGPIKSQPKINSFTFMGLAQQNQMEKPCQIKSIPLSSFRAAKPEKKQNQHPPAPVRYTYKYREIPLQRDVGLAVREEKEEMGYCCNNSFPASSHVLLTDLSQRWKCPKLQNLRHKGQFHGSQKASKVLAFYGLKAPPYKLDALEPHMSRRTLEMHWGEHHRGYVEGLNKQLEKDDILYGHTLDELVKVTYNNGNPLPEFNNAAQVWNHDFFWESMQPGGGDMPRLGLLEQIEKDFGSFTNFKEKFLEAALTLFGSGWVWLVLKRNERCLAVVKTSNAINPIVWDDIPIISLDVWEHAYYLDYKNDKGKYANVFMNHLVSWNAAAARMARAEAFVNLGEPKIPIA